jgi:hypothetical protein
MSENAEEANRRGGKYTAVNMNDFAKTNFKFVRLLITS